MLDERRFDGYWWLPSRPESKVPGSLSFSQSEIRLELLGSFSTEEFPTGPPADEPRILGVSRDQRAVTLENCMGLGATINTAGFPITTYGPHLVLDGAWYEPDEEVRFDEISVRLSDLDEWAETSGFRSDLNWDAEGQSIESIDVTYTPPQRIEVDLDDGTSVSIVFSWTWSGLQQVTTESRITQTATFGVRFGEGATLDRALVLVAYLRNFLSLGVARPIRVLSVRGFHNPPADASPDEFPGDRPERLNVEVLYRLVGVPEVARPTRADEMLFTLADAHPRLKEIFQTWFERQVTLGPVFTRFFHVLHTGKTSREHEFENYVRVLETHHRRTSTATDVPEDEHEARVQEIYAAAPNHRAFLERRLAYSNEPSLSRRLKATLARCPAVTERLIGPREEQKRFVRKVVVTRNYETHLDPSHESEAAEGVELVTLVYQLRALIEMTLLLEVGFACDDANAFLNRPRRFEFVEHLRSIPN